MKREKKRIALLYRGPQQEGRDDFSAFVPMGLFNVLKSLRDSGYAASLHNFSGTPRQRLPKAIREINADAILISAFFGCHHEAFLLARTAKGLATNAPVILGGPLSVLGPPILARFPEIDFLLRGEGEESSVALLDALFSGSQEFRNVPGVIFRSSSGYSAMPPRLLDDIDRYFFLPSEVMPHCHGVSHDNLAVLISSRGCPFHCAFCSSTVLWQNRVRHHSAELLLRYLKDLRVATRALYFSLRDENFLVNRRHVEEFTTALSRSGLNYLWNAQGSPHLLDDTTARMLADAGCDQIQMGIETVSPRLLALLNKKGDRDKTEEGIRTLRRRLIRPFGYFIYGMEETEDEGRETLRFIQKTGLLDAVASPLVMYPGTKLAAGVAPQIFFAKGEVLFYSPESAKKWKKQYETALTDLHRRGGFSREELFRKKEANLVTLIARHFYHLAHGEEGKAEKILLTMTQQNPENPWGFELLTRFYETTGENAKSLTMAKALTRLLTGKNRGSREAAKDAMA